MKGVDARSAANSRVILEPGRPPLVKRGDLWWTGLALPSLHALTLGLPDRRRTGGVLEDLLEPGDVTVVIDGDDGFPSEMQLLNLLWLEHMDEALASALVAAVLADYPRLQQAYDFLPDDEREVLLPSAVTEAVLRPLIRLESVGIHAIPHSSTPYLGVEFGCAWDDEHGLGVLTYGTEILAVGTADVSQDRGTARKHRDAVLKALKSQ